MNKTMFFEFARTFCLGAIIAAVPLLAISTPKDGWVGYGLPVWLFLNSVILLVASLRERKARKGRNEN